jgi:competence protein ComEA
VVPIVDLLRRRRLWLAGGVLAVAATLGALMTARGANQPAPALTPALAAPGPASALLVFVSGAVVHPGLYRLAPGARIADAIAAAGGTLPSADPGRLPNLAGLVHDGHQVNVPFAKGSAPASARVDANSATVAELQEIPGMTSDLAQAMVSTREAWGPFASISDLRAALGLDTATAALIGKHLSFLTAMP